MRHREKVEKGLCDYLFQSKKSYIYGQTLIYLSAIYTGGAVSLNSKAKCVRALSFYHLVSSRLFFVWITVAHIAAADLATSEEASVCSLL